ncbi:mismatch-specific DNA-glycosylase [Frigidibacter sp. ROC022]|uniref:mismatch-specific DNA-glycosylase n=1 Tax=Frigidibacter sp. ROC022 TaxID=2971796 RepID=UPI00215B6431|nr:mismatch-specific DNA-glycosylase [Frigidibacter sp. ROC022]MCR8723746.1 mismatch-specific DNA-glycosylase [Frigidibacter sp. ROC022]
MADPSHARADRPATANAPALDRHGALPASHAVPDLLTPGLRLVFCGTALGRVSALRRAYYANPTNKFWRTLHAVGLTPTRFAPQDYPKLLPLGIGLTDLAKAHYGNDAELPEGALDAAALTQRIAQVAPRMLAFTSKTAASAWLGRPTGRIAYGPQVERIGPTAIWVLPSPSGSASRYWDAAPWQALAREIG